MPIFDQRGSKVNKQFNIAGNVYGDINFGEVQDKTDLVAELKKLLAEVSKAAQSGNINNELSIDVEANIKKAIVQTEKPQPDKNVVLKHLGEAKALIEGVTSAIGLVAALSQAIEIVRRIF